MLLPASVPGVTTPSPSVGAQGKRRSATGTEQERRKAWGKQAGAKVAAAYKALQEGH